MCKIFQSCIQTRHNDTDCDDTTIPRRKFEQANQEKIQQKNNIYSSGMKRQGHNLKPKEKITKNQEMNNEMKKPQVHQFNQNTMYELAELRVNQSNQTKPTQSFNTCKLPQLQSKSPQRESLSRNNPKQIYEKKDESHIDQLCGVPTDSLHMTNNGDLRVRQPASQSLKQTVSYEEFLIVSTLKKQSYTNKKIIHLKSQPLYQRLILTQNEVLYLSQQNQSGKIYKVSYDCNFNPKFEIFVGVMSFDQDKGIEVKSKTCEYVGKSETKKSDQINLIDSNEIKQKETVGQIVKKIKIFDSTTGVLLNVNPIKTPYISKTWIKYNQQISEKDMQILKSTQWVTSSIIDSYVLYLNLKNSKQYFNSLQHQAPNNRLFIVNSAVFTSFFQAGIFFQVQKEHIQYFQKEFLEYKEIEYQLWEIYSAIAFVINKNNYHWLLILIDFQNKKIEIYDSMKQATENRYTIYFRKFFKELGFQKELTQSEFYGNGKQTDGYSCGYHACSFMRYLSRKYNGKKENYKYDESRIKKKLTKLISESN